MANNRTITSANAILTLSVTGLFDVPQTIQGFTADDVTEAASVDNKETSMGIDGRLSAGWMPVVITQSISLQADSLSNDLFENWKLAELQIRESYIASGTLVLTATGRKYTMTRGFLKGGMPFPSLKKTIQPRVWTIDWESVTAAPTLGIGGAGLSTLF